MLKLVIFLLMVVLSVAVQASSLGEYVRADAHPKVCGDGPDNICMMTFEEAEQYCASIGERLPTPRELANFAMSHGAKGIVESKYPNKYIYDHDVYQESQKLTEAGYSPIIKWTLDSSGNKIPTIDFYYTYKGGYRTPENEIHVVWYNAPSLWTSTRVEGWPYTEAYSFSTAYGTLDELSRDHWGVGVRCATDKN